MPSPLPNVNKYFGRHDRNSQRLIKDPKTLTLIHIFDINSYRITKILSHSKPPKQVSHINEALGSRISSVEMDKSRVATIETSILSLSSTEQLGTVARLAILDTSADVAHSGIRHIMRDLQISALPESLTPFCDLQEIHETRLLIRIAPRAILQIVEDGSLRAASDYKDITKVHFLLFS